MPEKRLYRAVPEFTQEQIKTAIEQDNVDLLKDIAFAVGYRSADWKYSQDICLKLSSHPDKVVRANAILGLSYVAMFQKRLDKRLVKPILLRALKDPDIAVREQAENVLPDINRALDWGIANYDKKERTFGAGENTEEFISKNRRGK